MKDFVKSHNWSMQYILHSYGIHFFVSSGSPLLIAIVYELAFLCLRLPFGTTTAPSEYMNVSEAAIDLGISTPGQILEHRLSKLTT